MPGSSGFKARFTDRKQSHWGQFIVGLYTISDMPIAREPLPLTEPLHNIKLSKIK